MASRDIEFEDLEFGEDVEVDRGSAPGHVRWRLEINEAEIPPSSQPPPVRKSSLRASSSLGRDHDQLLRVESFQRRINHFDSGYQTIPEEVPSGRKDLYADDSHSGSELDPGDIDDDDDDDDDDDESCRPSENPSFRSAQSFGSFESAFVSECGAGLQEAVQANVRDIDDIEEPGPKSRHRGQLSVSSFNDEGYGHSVVASSTSLDLERRPLFLPASPDPPRLQPDPLTPIFVSRDESLSSSDSDPEDSGSREDAIGELRVLSVAVYFLILRKHILNSEATSATPRSGALVFTSQESREGSFTGALNDDGGENSQQGATNESRSAQEPNSNPTGQGDNRRPSKRRRGESNGGDDDDNDRRKNNKRLKGKSTQPSSSDGRPFGCPFAKGEPQSSQKYPRCARTARQNLSGVKEHLKRKHFGGKLPEDIRDSKCWEDVFKVCNPNWDSTISPIPGPHPDYDGAARDVANKNAGRPTIIARSARSQSPRSESERSARIIDMNSAAQPSTGPSTREAGVLRSAEFPQVGNLGALSNPSILGNILGANFRAETATEVQEAARLLTQAAIPYCVQPVDPGIIREAQEYTAQDLGGYFVLPADEALNGMSQDFGISYDAVAALPGDYILLGPQATETSDLTLPFDQVDGNLGPSQVQPLTLVTGFPDTCIPSSSAEQTPDLAQSSEADTSTPLITPHSSEPQKKPADNQLRLIVARRPPVPGSKESHGPKDFRFDNYADFRKRFENWMVKTFFHPEFSWETMEFTGTDVQAPGECPVIITNIEELAMEVEMHQRFYKTQTAVVRLVMKKNRLRGMLIITMFYKFNFV
ncbi:hypothetical protein TWF481_006161 [Arthrobotrys musiformis]|uniref:C2H2-type domain-containing protein n=1 Tax=Arthrobotrys musiformis TaxID=47236 RepID=A0AAV9WFV5_9PEZI